MINRIPKLLMSPFLRNVFVMISGTAAAQFVNIILSPIITRLYGPEAFGVMGVFNTIISIIGPISALTLPIAIVLPRNNSEARSLIWLSLLIATCISIITVLILMLYNKQIIAIFNISEIDTYLYLIPLVIMFSAFMQVSEQWLIRTKQFNINAKVTFLQSLLINGSKVGIGFYYPLASVLVILTAVSNGLKAFLMTLSARRSIFKQKLILKPKIALKLLVKYKDFPLFRAPETLINGVSQGLPLLMLTSLFGPVSAGYYALGRNVLGLPSNLIGKSVGDVFYPRISEAANNGENLTKLIKKATVSLALIGLIPYGIIFLFGPSIFSFVFGSEWVIAGEYARWISLFSFFGLINKPSIKALPVLSAQLLHLLFTVFMLISRIIALFIGFYVFSDDLISITLFGITGAIVNLSLIFITLKKSKSFDRLLEEAKLGE